MLIPYILDLKLNTKKNLNITVRFPLLSEPRDKNACPGLCWVWGASKMMQAEAHCVTPFDFFRLMFSHKKINDAEKKNYSKNGVHPCK